LALRVSSLTIPGLSEGTQQDPTKNEERMEIERRYKKQGQKGNERRQGKKWTGMERMHRVAPKK